MLLTSEWDSVLPQAGLDWSGFILYSLWILVFLICAILTSGPYWTTAVFNPALRLLLVADPKTLGRHNRGSLITIIDERE